MTLQTVTGDRTVAMQLAYATAKSGSPVVVFSTAELSRHGLFDELVTAGVVDLLDSEYDLPLYVDDTPNLTLAELEVKVARLVGRCFVEHGRPLGAFVVDDLHHMHPAPGNDVGALLDLNRGIAALAEELSCAAVVVIRESL